MTKLEESPDKLGDAGPKNMYPGLRNLLMFASGLFNLAEEEVQGWVRRLTERRNIRSEETARLLGEALRKQKEATLLVEQWLEDRVRSTRIINPRYRTHFKQLQSRLDVVKRRVEALSERVKTAR